jgi:hypothetical protein
MPEPIHPPTSEPFPQTEIEAHDEHDHIAAVFPDRDLAEAAVDELRALGLGSDHLGIAVRSDDHVVFEHDIESETMHDIGVAAAVGVPVGFVAGLALAALAVPGLAVGGLLALAGVGAGWGGFLGSYVGLAAEERTRGEHEEIEMTPLGPGEVLVVVCSHGHAEAVYEVMRRYQGRLRLIATSHP